MQTETKLAVLEVMAGIFGWASIGALVTALYGFGMALLNGYPWSTGLWALVSAAIAKWLAAGTKVCQQRVVLEAKLISQGYTLEEASREWLAQYMGRK